MVKDFFWFLFKSNFVVNCIYLYLFKYIFKELRCFSEKGFPLTTKDMILNSVADKSFCSLKGYTSGTTNQPMTVYRSFKSILLEEYMVKTFLKRSGVPLNPKIAVLRGDMVKASTDNQPPFWKKMPFTRRVFFSSFHLSAANVPAYLAQLEIERPDIIMAYPSSITFLAKQAKLIGWQPNWPFYGVFTSSESFSAQNQQVCREVFGKVFDHYGQAERVAALQQCEVGHYHVREDYSFVEFIDDEFGTKIIGTNYHNSAMKLVRYDTGDYVEGLHLSGNCPCGNKSPYVERIIGRDDDYVVLPDGRHVGRLDVAFKGIEGLLECQLVQPEPELLEIHYVPLSAADTVELEKDLSQALRERLGEDIALKFMQSIAIPRTKAGKFRSVIRLNKES